MEEKSTQENSQLEHFLEREKIYLKIAKEIQKVTKGVPFKKVGLHKQIVMTFERMQEILDVLLILGFLEAKEDGKFQITLGKEKRTQNVQNLIDYNKTQVERYQGDIEYLENIIKTIS